ncbi:MAG: hypothetical protein KA801_09200, partial [Syntrophorhabdaceae bacterium]|nr:hypothetical protein [Syntrophorhabdaceae bacterium]
QILLFRKDKGGKDHMTIKVERAQGIQKSHDADKHIAKTIEKEVKRQVLVSCDVEVEDYGSLPRSERKTKRVYDNRDA